jgi:hypothetical protein
MLRNATGTNYVDLNATNTQNFLKCGPGLSVQANGNATFSGTVDGSTINGGTLSGTHVHAAYFHIKDMVLVNDYGALCSIEATYSYSPDYTMTVNPNTRLWNPGVVSIALYPASWSPSTDKRDRRFLLNYGDVDISFGFHVSRRSNAGEYVKFALAYAIIESWPGWPESVDSISSPWHRLCQYVEGGLGRTGNFSYTFRWSPTLSASTRVWLCVPASVHNWGTTYQDYLIIDNFWLQTQIANINWT